MVDTWLYYGLEIERYEIMNERLRSEADVKITRIRATILRGELCNGVRYGLLCYTR